MLGTVRIRQFSAPDTEAVLAIYSASKLDELAFESVVPSLLPLKKDKARFEVFMRSRVFVAEADCPLGYVALLGSQVTGLFVHPKARGFGIGGMLLAHALSLVEGPATLSVAASNVPAVRLYEKHGFAVSARFVAEYNGVQVNALAMRQGARSAVR